MGTDLESGALLAFAYEPNISYLTPLSERIWWEICDKIGKGFGGNSSTPGTPMCIAYKLHKPTTDNPLEKALFEKLENNPTTKIIYEEGFAALNRETLKKYLHFWLAQTYKGLIKPGGKVRTSLKATPKKFGLAPQSRALMTFLRTELDESEAHKNKDVVLQFSFTKPIGEINAPLLNYGPRKGEKPGIYTLKLVGGSDPDQIGYFTIKDIRLGDI
ncbi:MAG: hypothetical protein ABIE74_09445 [Pseudomonadota bacterium]